VRIVAIADTHGFHRQLAIPDGDILIHAGDLTDMGEIEQLADLAEYLDGLPHPFKVVVAGNHDFCLERDPEAARRILRHCTYLQDEAVVIECLTIHGSPWSPRYKEWALSLARGAPIKAKWDLIPPMTDILVTHAAPRGIGDRVADGSEVGCEDLLAAIDRVRPRLHVYGHIHHSAGIYRRGQSVLINASVYDESYRPTRPAVIYDLVLP